MEFPTCNQSFQSLSHVQLFAGPWTAAYQASLSITNFQSLLKLIFIESVMPSNHLILRHPHSPPAFSLSQQQGLFQWDRVSLVAQMVKNLPAVRETWVWSLGWKDPLEKGIPIHSSILAWRNPMDRGAWLAGVHRVSELDITEVTKHNRRNMQLLFNEFLWLTVYQLRNTKNTFIIGITYLNIPTLTLHQLNATFIDFLLQTRNFK